MCNRSDPFGLCPPTDANVKDCDGSTNIGAAWIALDGTGKRGQNVIAGIVANNILVSLGGGAAVSTSCEGGTERGCLKGKLTMHLNSDDAAGVLAVTIAHEWFHFGQESRLREDVRGQAADEVTAMMSARPIYTGLRGDRRKEARAMYQPAFDALTTRVQREAYTSQLCNQLAQEAGVSNAKC